MILWYEHSKQDINIFIFEKSILEIKINIKINTQNSNMQNNRLKLIY